MRVLITNPAVGVKPMLVSMLLPSRTAARLAPLPRCARITRPFAAAGSRRREFLHQIGVGQAVEAVALDALRRVAPRDRQQPGDPRHGAVKRGVEARHLGQLRMALPERLDQPDLARQVLGVIRRDAVQFREQLRRDPLRFGMRHAVHHAVSHGLDRREDRLRLEPVQQNAHRRAVVGGGKAAGDLRLCQSRR